MRLRLEMRTTIARMALIHALVFGAMTVLAIAVVYVQSTRLAMREIRAALDEQAAGLADVYRDEGLDGLRREIARRGAAHFDPEAVYALWSASGELLAGNVSPPLPAADGEVELQLSAGGGSHPAIARLLRFDQALLLVGRDVAARLDSRTDTLWLLATTLVMVAVIGLGGALLGGRGLLRRVDAIAATSARIAGGELHQRVPLRGSGDEFDRLAQAVNGMLDRIEDLTGGLQTVLDAVAHDLRKPLTHAQQALEAALAAVPDPAAAELEHVERALARIRATLDALLHIVQADSGANVAEMASCRLDRIVADLVELYEPLAQAAGTRLVAGPMQALQLVAHRELLAQALANLIDNAIKYASGGREVRIEVATSANGASISVRDHGPGIPAAQRERAQQRFVRLHDDPAVPGSGLGLSLVAAVARLHRGRLRLEDAAPGLRAVIEVPLDPLAGHSGREV